MADADIGRQGASILDNLGTRVHAGTYLHGSEKVSEIRNSHAECVRRKIRSIEEEEINSPSLQYTHVYTSN